MILPFLRKTVNVRIFMHYQESKKQKEIFRHPALNYFDIISLFSIVSPHCKSKRSRLLSLETDDTRLYDLDT